MPLFHVFCHPLLIVYTYTAIRLMFYLTLNIRNLLFPHHGTQNQAAA